MGNLDDIDFTDSGGDGPPPRSELEKLRAFRLAVACEVPILETHASRMSAAFPQTSAALRRLIAAFQASE